MVGRITKGASIRGVLEYNAGKVRNGEATVLYGNLVLGDCEQSDTFDMRRALLSFQPYLDTRKIKDPVFHESLNPDITDCLTDAQLTEIAREYMERMGFGQQPYYVFKHRDIDREHIHIVSVRIDEYGRKLDHNFERRRSVDALQSIERRYGLRPAVKGQEQREFDTARRVEYGRDNLKQQMKSAVRLLAEQYRFGSISEFRTLLNLYNVDLEERRGEADGKRWNGIVYTATDERGAWVGTPIKSSALTLKGGYKFLQKQIARNDADIKSEQIKGPIRAAVARAMHRARTQDERVNSFSPETPQKKNGGSKSGSRMGICFSVVLCSCISLLSSSRCLAPSSISRLPSLHSIKAYRPSSRCSTISASKSYRS